jgi:hypothetical protein
VSNEAARTADSSVRAGVGHLLRGTPHRLFHSGRVTGHADPGDQRHVHNGPHRADHSAAFGRRQQKATARVRANRQRADTVSHQGRRVRTGRLDDASRSRRNGVSIAAVTLWCRAVFVT